MRVIEAGKRLKRCPSYGRVCKERFGLEKNFSYDRTLFKAIDPGSIALYRAFRRVPLVYMRILLITIIISERKKS